MQEIMVSIICMTFNHEQYIKDALEGFVKQKTSFKYEVIVHDDASTDRTREIIKKYEDRYPDIIKPIYQSDNQYSKRIPIVKKYIQPKVTGKYITICEGDDYWCDENKLQRQVDFLEKHSDYVACVHNTEFMYMSTGKSAVRYNKEDKDLSLRDCVMCGGQSFHTSSIMVRREIYFNKPEFTRMIKGVGDYPSAIYYSLSGKIHYFGSVMSVYRVGTVGSWSDRIERDNNKMIKVTNSTIEMLKMADEFSNQQFHDVFIESIEANQYRLCIYKQDYKSAIKYTNEFRKEPFYQKIKYLLFAYIPISLTIRNHLRGVK